MKNKLNIDKETLVQLYIKENNTTAELAIKFNTSVATINRLLKKYNIKKDMALKAAKISSTKQNKTIEEKAAYAVKISESRTGKGLGKIPWNKGKHTGNGWTGRHHTEETKQKISSTKQAKSLEEKQLIEQKRKASRGHIEPWNKGLTYTMSKEIIQQAKEKEIATKKLNGTFTKSALEENFYVKLKEYFPEKDIYRQYFDKTRYPFSCDFYIKPLDLFIELNGNWTHGFRPFDSNDASCIDQLKRWQEKAKHSEYYKNAIYTWTDLDVRKRIVAYENNLLYVQLYTDADIDNFFKTLEVTH